MLLRLALFFLLTGFALGPALVGDVSRARLPYYLVVCAMLFVVHLYVWLTGRTPRLVALMVSVEAILLSLLWISFADRDFRMLIFLPVGFLVDHTFVQQGRLDAKERSR